MSHCTCDYHQEQNKKRRLGEKKAVKEYIMKVLLDFHKSSMENKGFDFFFVLSNDLDELNKEKFYEPKQ